MLVIFHGRLPTCPRLPRIRELKKELEEIYMRGPVEAAVRLARNAMDLHLQEEQQLRPPAPITSPLPEAPSWASPAQRCLPAVLHIQWAVLHELLRFEHRLGFYISISTPL